MDLLVLLRLSRKNPAAFGRRCARPHRESDPSHPPKTRSFRLLFRYRAMLLRALAVAALATPAALTAQTPLIPVPPPPPQTTPASRPAPAAAQPAAAAAQPAAPDTTLDKAPPQLATREIERSRKCVPVLNRLAALEAELDPLYEKAGRIQALSQAVALEDSMRVVPFNAADSIDAAVRKWFVDDMALAIRAVNGGGEAVTTQRNQAREAIIKKLQAALDPLRTQVETKLSATGDLDKQAEPCDGAVLVRPVVQEACATTTGALCDAAKTVDPAGRYPFVNAAEDLWQIEELRVWTEPGPLQPTANGGLGGARTGALSRRGNLVVTVGLEPILQLRAGLDTAAVKRFQTNLDSLGFTFDDPRYVMAPGIAVTFNPIGPIAGETHYLLHFGNLSKPDEDVIWTGLAAEGTDGLQEVVPANRRDLVALAAGEPLHLTAVKISEDGKQAEALYTIDVTPASQARAVSVLIAYMGNGSLAKDLKALVPATPPPPPPGNR
jgi:hypothetical protein